MVNEGLNGDPTSLDCVVIAEQEHRHTRFEDLQFRDEALNVLNHANWANPNTTFGSPTFGQVTGLQRGNQSRIIQLTLYLTFRMR